MVSREQRTSLLWVSTHGVHGPPAHLRASFRVQTAASRFRCPDGNEEICPDHATRRKKKNGVLDKNPCRLLGHHQIRPISSGADPRVEPPGSPQPRDIAAEGYARPIDSWPHFSNFPLETRDPSPIRLGWEAPYWPPCVADIASQPHETGPPPTHEVHTRSTVLTRGFGLLPRPSAPPNTVA